MQADALNQIIKIDTVDFGRDKMIIKLANFSILSLLFVFLGAINLRADNLHRQMIDGITINAEIAPFAQFSSLPVGQPLKNQIDNDLSDLVGLAREIVGRIDMTSASGWILDQAHDQKDSKSSLRITHDCFLLPGQKTKHVASQSERENETHCTSEIRHDKSTTINSPTNNPLSFAREYLQTKK